MSALFLNKNALPFRTASLNYGRDCMLHNVCNFNQNRTVTQLSWEKKETILKMKFTYKPEPIGGSGDLFQPIQGVGWSDDFKTPTQVAVTCSSSAHIVDHNFHDCTSHDSL